MIICSHCREKKSDDNFSPSKRKKRICRDCHALEARERNRRNPRYELIKRTRHLKKNYGMTIEEYEELLRKQKGLCAICRKVSISDARVYAIKTGGRNLCVDHDHILNKNRGLLCSACNFALGLFRENPKFLYSACKYLRQYSSSRISRDQMMAEIAHIVAARGTCPRARVGAVITRDSRIVSIGYNGALEGEDHCEDVGCIIENNHCLRSTHAEQNAVAYAARQGITLLGTTIYITYPICSHCEKIVKAAGIEKIKIV